MAPPPAPWADGLAVDLLLLILTELCCQADRASFASVCRRWREVAKLAKPAPSQIPWLLLPSPAPTPSIFSFFSGLRRRIRSLPADFRRERLCGSHPGGWVAAALGPFGGHLLANIYSGARIDLPHRLMNFEFSTTTPLLIRAVMLSAAPTDAHCVAAAMVCGASNIAFCRPGVDSEWYAHPEITTLQDMVYYEGEAMQGFHVLGDLEDNVRVLTFKVGEAEDGHGETFMQKRSEYTMPERTPDTLLSVLPKSTSRTGYLVVSRNKLLLVLRYYCRDSKTGARRTLLFRVFEMEVQKSAKKGENHRATWVELDDLDDRVIFVARGCSRAFEAPELHGFIGGSIYYLDDAELDVLPFLQNQAEYPCSDMGMYSIMPGDTVRPGLDAPKPANIRPGPAIYGAPTYLKWFSKDDNANHKQSVVEMTEDEALHSTGGQIIGIRWSILSEPHSKFSPPIWFCP
ncbi:unnamed protein product [Urochloa humidicola]